LKKKTEENLPRRPSTCPSKAARTGAGVNSKNNQKKKERERGTDRNKHNKGVRSEEDPRLYQWARGIRYPSTKKKHNLVHEMKKDLQRGKKGSKDNVRILRLRDSKDKREKGSERCRSVLAGDHERALVIGEERGMKNNLGKNLIFGV